MDPIISKAAGIGPGTAQQSPVDRAPKAEPSKFDKVREELKAQQAGAPGEDPGSVQKTADAQSAQPAHRANQLDATRAPSRDIFSPQVEKNGQQLQTLQKRVDQLPQSGALDGLKKRLSMLDEQHSSIQQSLGKIDSSSQPTEYLNMQAQVYQMTEQLELATKVVEQLTSGVKSILQTQV